jgi:hypothetical protein
MTTMRGLVTITRCSEISGLNPWEMLVGVLPASRHERQLEAYRSGLLGTGGSVCATIVADIRLALEQGAPEHAADLLVVLRRYLAQKENACEEWLPGRNLLQRSGNLIGQTGRRTAIRADHSAHIS